MKSKVSYLAKLLLIALFCLLSGCEGSVENQDAKAKELIRSAEILYKKKKEEVIKEAYLDPQIRLNAEKAFLKYQEVQRKAPDSKYVPQALDRMAQIRDEFGPANEALAFWLKLVYDYPDSEYTEKADLNVKRVVKKWMAAADNHLYRNRFAEAITLYKQVLKINSYNAEAHLALGDVYAKSKRYDEAIREYKIAVEIDPNYTEAQYLLGLVYLAKDQAGEALAQFELVAGINPEMVAAYYNMALIYNNKLKDKKKAKNAWKKYFEHAKGLEKEKKWLPTARYYLKSL